MRKICKTIPMKYDEGYAETNGVKIFYRDYGPKDADPILLVHGLGAQLVHWPEDLINFLLNNNLRPITFDNSCLLYTSPSPRDRQKSRMPSSA